MLSQKSFTSICDTDRVIRLNFEVSSDNTLIDANFGDAGEDREGFNRDEIIEINGTGGGDGGGGGGGDEDEAAFAAVEDC